MRCVANELAWFLIRCLESFFVNALTFRGSINSFVKVTVSDEAYLLSPLSEADSRNQVNVSIQIEDNGIGMSDAFLRRDYFQAMTKQVGSHSSVLGIDRSSDLDMLCFPFQDQFSNGTGLSVYLAQELLHLTNGRVAVSSLPGAVCLYSTLCITFYLLI